MDPGPILRAQLQAAIDGLAPEVRGLQGLSSLPLSQAAIRIVTSVLAVRKRRLDRLSAVIAAQASLDAKLAALYDDGFPNLPPVSGVQLVFTEIQDEDADLHIAANLFQNGAASIDLDLEHIVHMPQPIPVS